MDKFDEAVAYLTEHPYEIQLAWDRPSNHTGGCLFRFCSPNQQDRCGCLTQVRRLDWGAFTFELTTAIRQDERIPSDVNDIKVEHLPVFAEWQRRLDQYFAILKVNSEEASKFLAEDLAAVAKS